MTRGAKLDMGTGISHKTSIIELYFKGYTFTEIETKTNHIHDLSGAITHKREIITLYLLGYLTPDIALKTNHSKEAVDRYIKDYHKVEMLWKHGINNLDQISQLLLP